MFCCFNPKKSAFSEYFYVNKNDNYNLTKQ